MDVFINIINCLERIVEIIKKEGKANASPKGHEECNNDVSHSSRPDRSTRHPAGLGNTYVIHPAGISAVEILDLVHSCQKSLQILFICLQLGTERAQLNRGTALCCRLA